MLLDGCQEGKHTPKLVEVPCPRCGAMVELFVRMNGPHGEAGTLVQEERCACGFVFPAGSFAEEYGIGLLFFSAAYLVFPGMPPFFDNMIDRKDLPC